MSRQCYCRIDGIPYGPLSLQELQRMALNGKLLPLHPLRKGESGEWQPAMLVRGLAFMAPGVATVARGGRLTNGAIATLAIPPVSRQSPPARSSRIETQSSSAAWFIILSSIAVLLAASIGIGAAALADITEQKPGEKPPATVDLPIPSIRDRTFLEKQVTTDASAGSFSYVKETAALQSIGNPIPPTQDEPRSIVDPMQTGLPGDAKVRQQPKLKFEKNKEKNGLKTIKRQRRFAVSRTRRLNSYDSIEALLKSLGKGYQYDEIEDIQLMDSNRISKYDVIFLPCGDYLTNHRIRDNLREFVKNGGTIYASDLRYGQIAKSFPEYVNKVVKRKGQKAAKLAVNITDPQLKQLFGRPMLGLRFDMNLWQPAAFDRTKVKVLLHGTYWDMAGNQSFGLFLIKFTHGKGTVIFTSFHNGAQRNDTERKLLRHLVVTTVTAKIETFINQTIISGGFTPVKTNRIGLPPGVLNVTRSFDNLKKCQLRFDLGIGDQRAKFRLTLIAPTGKKHERIGNTSFNITIPDAAKGPWRYTVTALETPYENFPFTLTIGQAEE